MENGRRRRVRKRARARCAATIASIKYPVGRYRIPQFRHADRAAGDDEGDAVAGGPRCTEGVGPENLRTWCSTDPAT